MPRRHILAFACLFTAVAAAHPASAATPLTQDWGLQLATNENDLGNDVAADPLGVYVVGSSAGSLGAPNPSTNPDAFLLRYDRSGNRLWGRHLGDIYTDRAFGVFSDPAGGAYVTGSTGSDLNGTNRGGYDQFLARYDAVGTRLWTRQIGTPINDAGFGVSADALGNVFVGGNTFGSLAATNTGINRSDATLSRYDRNGNLAWTRQWGQEGSDNVHAVTADGRGGVFVAGDSTFFGGVNEVNVDAVIRRYDQDGNVTWSRTLASQPHRLDDIGVVLTLPDQALGITPDGRGGIYVSGQTQGSIGTTNPQPGTFDAFLARYDADGNLLWSRTLASLGQDVPGKVTADGRGGVYITGSVVQPLPGQTHQGARDAYVVKFDGSGNLLWTTQFGSSGTDDAYGISADGLGGLYVTGTTTGNLFAPNQGDPYDAFLVRFTEVPEPTLLLLAITPFLALARRSRRGSKRHARPHAPHFAPMSSDSDGITCVSSARLTNTEVVWSSSGDSAF